MTSKKRTKADDAGPRVRLGLAAAVYFALSFIYFLPALLPGRQIFGTDYLAGGYFFYEFTSHRLAAGALPKWVPYIYGGLPLFANPGSAFHPFRFIGDLLFSVKGILPTIFILQFGVAGLGMYLLARELEVREWIAALAGLAFEFTGLTMSFVFAGQDGRIIVATSAPLLFFFLHRGIRTGRVAPFAGAAGTVGFALLSFQIQTAYYLLLGATAWAIFCLLAQGWARRPGPLLRRIGLGLAAVAFAFGMAAVNFLPFLDYVPASPRGGAEGRGYDYSITYSMPPSEVLGLAVPEQAGSSVTNDEGQLIFPPYQPSRLSPFKLHTEYVGALVVALLFLGALYSRKDRHWWFFAGLGALALSMAFGGYTPLFRAYYALLPGANKFRAPNLTFFLVSTALVAMAAITLERMARLRDERAASARRTSAGPDPLGLVAWVMGALLALSIIGAAVGAGTAGTIDGTGRAIGWLRFAFFLAATGAGLWLWSSGRISSRAAALILAVVTLADLWVMDRHYFRTTEGPEQMFAADDIVNFLRSQPGPFRVWLLPSPPFPAQATYPRQGDFLMHFDLDQAGGEHPVPLQRFLEFAGAGQRSMVDWHNFLQHPVFMDAANIRYLVTGMPIQAPGLKEVHRGQYGVVYENTAAMPRAWLVDSVQVAQPPDGALTAMKAPGFDPAHTAILYAPPPEPLPSGPLTGAASVTSDAPDRVVVETRASRAALLVLADNEYQGWEATVDGQPRPILLTNHAFRGVEVPAGEHRVVFRFRPADLRLGFAIYLGTMAVLAAYGAGLILIGALRRRRAGAPA